MCVLLLYSLKELCYSKYRYKKKRLICTFSCGTGESLNLLSVLPLINIYTFFCARISFSNALR